MATVLDITLLGFFLPLFIFLFIFVMIYAILEGSKIFGAGNRALNLVAALSVAFVAVLTGQISEIFTKVIPWFVFLLFVMIFIFMLYRFFGQTDEEIWNLFGSTTVFVLILVIVLVGITQVFEETLSPYVGGDAVVKTPASEVLATLTHPRILGALFIIIVTSLAMRLLVDKFD